MCIWPTTASLSALAVSSSICSPNLQCFPRLWPRGENTQASKPAEDFQEPKLTQEERRCEEKRADSPVKGEVETWKDLQPHWCNSGYQFRMFLTLNRLFHSVWGHTCQWMSITAGTRTFLLLQFFYLFISLCIQIYSWIRQKMQFPPSTHLRCRARPTRAVKQVLLTGRETKEKAGSLVQMFDLLLWTYGGFLFRFVLLSSLWEHNAARNCKHIDQPAMIVGTKVDIWTDVTKPPNGNELL